MLYCLFKKGKTSTASFAEDLSTVFRLVNLRLRETDGDNRLKSKRQNQSDYKLPCKILCT